ncbi:hypothetical protein Tco_1275151 [Tanacetum coccineum]
MNMVMVVRGWRGDGEEGDRVVSWMWWWRLVLVWMVLESAEVVDRVVADAGGRNLAGSGDGAGILKRRGVQLCVCYESKKPKAISAFNFHLCFFGFIIAIEFDWEAWDLQLGKQYEKLVIASRAKNLEKTHDPLALVAHTSSSSRSPQTFYATRPSSVVDYDDEYLGETLQNDPEDPLTSAMMLLAHVITPGYSTPMNNRLLSSSNTRNQVVVQADRVNIQSRNVRNDGIIARHSYNVQEGYAESSNVQKDTGNVQRNLQTSSSRNVTNV